jgi:tryptophan-rich sensory protein
MTKLPKATQVIIAILICQSAGLIGTIFTQDAVNTWYADLAKPDFAPPNWLFAPVWISLYTLMGISLFLIWQQGKKAKWPLIIFYIQLIFNALWSIIFFGLQNISLALVEIILLAILIMVNIIQFWPLDKRASLFLMPYLFWVSFAGILNYYLFLLN